MPESSFNVPAYNLSPSDEAGQDLGDSLYDAYKLRRKQWPDDVANQVEREISLQTIDQNWTNQIDTMARLREGIHLRSYGNVNPLQDYVNEGQQLFRECLESISVDATFKFLNVVVQIRKPQPQPQSVSAVSDAKND